MLEYLRSPTELHSAPDCILGDGVMAQNAHEEAIDVEISKGIRCRARCLYILSRATLCTHNFDEPSTLLEHLQSKVSPVCHQIDSISRSSDPQTCSPAS